MRNPFKKEEEKLEIDRKTRVKRTLEHSRSKSAELVGGKHTEKRDKKSNFAPAVLKEQKKLEKKKIETIRSLLKKYNVNLLQLWKDTYNFKIWNANHGVDLANLSPNAGFYLFYGIWSIVNRT
jgi:hypothetical protein